MASLEPILQENKDRFVIFPVKHHDIWDWYKKMEANFWTAEEIDLQQDLNHWNTNLSTDEKNFIKHILAFFATSHAVLRENLAKNFMNEVQYPEARTFYGFQISRENIHFETYSLLIDTYIKDEQEKTALFKASAHQKKNMWAQKWGKSSSFAERLIAFAAIEKIFFSGAFCSIFWLGKQGLLPGLCLASQLVARDKGVQSGFGVHLHNKHLVNRLPKERRREIILEAHSLERKFITASFPNELMGMKRESLLHYLESDTDQLLLQLECTKELGTEDPLSPMDPDSLQEKTHFLEKRVGAFKNAGTTNKEPEPFRSKNQES